jgi:hypothetical protein
MERELGEVRGELKQINRGIDRLQDMAEKTLEASAANTALLGHVLDRLEKQEGRLVSLEAEVRRQGGKLADIEDDFEKHVAADVPVNVEVGRWAVRVVVGVLAAIGTAVIGFLGTLIWERLKM